MKKELLFGLSITLASTGAIAADWSFDQWDADADGVVSEEEFGLGFDGAGLFDTWDADGDGLLAENEWDEIGVDEDYTAWDEDGDSLLSEDEVQTGLYDSWEQDGDGALAENEWDDAGDEGWFDV